MNGAPAYSNSHQNILRLADIFCVNESEAEIYTNSIVKIDGIASANKVLSLLLEQGCKIVIITLGPLGAIFASRDEPESQWVKIPKIENPIDTTVSIQYIILFIILNLLNIFRIIYFQGAGDAFLGTLAYFIVHMPHLNLYEKIRRACVVASKTVQSKGTQKSFPFKNDLPEELFN